MQPKPCGIPRSPVHRQLSAPLRAFQSDSGSLAHKHQRNTTPHQIMSSLSSPSQADPPESGVREQHKEMLRQHQSMSSLPTRSRADQPNSGVWEQHKETLRQLYLLQGNPLKQVMKIMHQEHDFVATYVTCLFFR